MPKPFAGKRCEYLTSLSFSSNNSYVEMEPLSVKPSANVTITFASRQVRRKASTPPKNVSQSCRLFQENGVLLYIGERQHLAVELFRGRIRVSYDVGNYPVSTMFSYELVADGK